MTSLRTYVAYEQYLTNPQLATYGPTHYTQKEVLGAIKYYRSFAGREEDGLTDYEIATYVESLSRQNKVVSQKPFPHSVAFEVDVDKPYCFVSFYETQCDIRAYAVRAKHPVIPIDSLERLIVKMKGMSFLSKVVNMPLYSTIYILAVDEWDRPISKAGVSIEYSLIMSRVRSILLILQGLEPEWDDIECHERYVANCMEDGQAKLLSMSLWSLYADKPEVYRYYGSGTGNTYATSVLRAELEKKNIEKFFFDPLAVHPDDLPVAIVDYEGWGFSDVFDENSILRQTKLSGGMIKFYDSTTRPISTMLAELSSTDWYHFRPAFHYEYRALRSADMLKYLYYFVNSASVRSAALCSCYLCKTIKMLAMVSGEEVDIMAAKFHGTNYAPCKGKLPGRTAYVVNESKHLEHSGVGVPVGVEFAPTYGIVLKKNLNFDRCRWAERSIRTTCVDWGSGRRPLQVYSKKFISWDNTSTTFYDRDVHSIYACQSVHHDPYHFFFTLLKGEYVRVAIIDHDGPPMFERSNHTGRYLFFREYDRIMKSLGYNLVNMEQEGAAKFRAIWDKSSDYLMLRRDRRLNRSKIGRKIKNTLPDMRVFREIYGWERHWAVPWYLQPVYWLPPIYDFIMDDVRYTSGGELAIEYFKKFVPINPVNRSVGNYDHVNYRSTVDLDMERMVLAAVGLGDELIEKIMDFNDF
jgi:hypothetical protein